MNEKHLEFIQSNISRMNQCSFQMKGWAVTVLSAFLAIFASSATGDKTGNTMYLFLAIVPTALFWILDSIYLSKEHKMIALYNDVAKVSKEEDRLDIKPYEIPLLKYRGWKYSVFKAMLSPTEIILYGTMILGLILFGVLYR